ncbi:ERF family protein [Kitasatospora purpeofusca]|uniref:ERF family protein n=1 Tax=Kitasatospora purpeofusca TaxID=67352 RepID=UPI0035DDF1D4
MGLAENAATLAGTADTAPPAAPQFEELPDHDDFEPGPGDPEQVPVHIAWNRLMRDVRAIAKGGKGGQFRSNGAGNYDFRGVDRTVNAIGPAARARGIIVAPVKVDTEYRTSGKARECTVTVTWQIIGPKGDTMPGHWQSAGEALDYSDKATAKAQSVALRVLLLTAAMVPTGDPDPDKSNIERGEEPRRTAESYRDEMVDPKTSYRRIQQIGHEVEQAGMLGVRVQNEVGDYETLMDLGKRKLAELSSGGAQ